MKNNVRTVWRCASAAALCAAATGVNAHHSAAGKYDLAKTVEITGVVVDYRLISPHSVLTLDAKAADGSVARWEVEMSSSTNLRRGRGWDENTFESGDVVTVAGAPHRSGQPLMVGRDFIRDGAPISAGRPPRVEEVYPPEPNARGLSGRWLPPWGGQGSDPNRPAGTPLSLSAAGREARERYKPETSPVATCEPMNVPTLFYPAYLFDLRVGDREVVMQYELYDVKRVIPLSGAPARQEQSGRFGEATARLENGVLTIESGGFPPSDWGLAIAVEPNGNGGDIPSSSGKRLVERYSVSDDQKTLLLDYTIEDPMFLAAPYSARVEMKRLSTEAPMHEFACDAESAGRFIGERRPPP